MSATCNRNCPINAYTLHPEAKHYLECPVWDAVLSRSSLSSGWATEQRQLHADGARRGARQAARPRWDTGVIVCYSMLLATLCALFYLYIWRQ